jgi:hypothetical protein
MNPSRSKPETPMPKYKGRDLDELKKSLLGGNEDDLSFAEREFLTEEFYKVTESSIYKVRGPHYFTYDSVRKLNYWKEVWSDVEFYAQFVEFVSPSTASKVAPRMPTVKQAKDPQRRIISQFTARIKPSCKFLNAVYQSNARPKGPGNVRGKGEWLSTIPELLCQGWMHPVPMSSKKPATCVDFAKVDGLVTDNMGACITVVCLFKWRKKEGDDFDGGAMKHMAGGYRTDFDWTSLINGLTTDKVTQWCSSNNAFALVATSRDNLDTSDIGNVLGALRQLGFLPNNIIVDMLMAGGCAVNKTGKFGVPVNPEVVPPAPQLPYSVTGEKWGFGLGPIELRSGRFVPPGPL